ncbi:hypothetical protein KR044_002571 [Drosophila immigrans]|nr:hypothetical protein KR044_002571 [Drosophila immigrans]
MSLDGAQLSFVNAGGISVAHSAKGRKFNVGSFLGCDLVLPDAERVHCEIQCDAFGRVSIYNHSCTAPIVLNDQVLPATAKRPLMHGARIKILDEVYTWSFPKADDVSTPERAPPEQAANSSPSLKGHRQRRQFDNRLTVHNFRYSINSDDEGNTSIESRELESSAEIAVKEDPEPQRSITPPAKDADGTLPKVDLLEATQNKENTSTLGNKLMLQLCARSDVVITSFSPRETGVKVEKSFTCVVKPTACVGLSSTSSTPKSVYNTPKSVLSELNEDSCSRDLLEYSTPSTSKKAQAGKRPTSMYLIDLTTPQKLRPTLSVTPKQTPSSVGVISVNSTDMSSGDSPIVIDISNSSTPSFTPSKQQQIRILKTPKQASSATPKRTPQSLMKRALLSSAKKQIAANTNTPTTPQARTNRQSLLDARRQCLTAPRRLPFHPQPQWRTPGRRQMPALTTKAPQTSPRKRQSMSLSSPRDNKNSMLRKTLAANAKHSPTIGLSNKLVAKARRSLSSPKPESPKRMASPRVTANESITPDIALDSTRELSLTFTIDDDGEQNSTGAALKALMAEEVVGIESIKEQSYPHEDADIKTATGKTDEEEYIIPNETSREDTLNKTFDLNVSETSRDLNLPTENASINDQLSYSVKAEVVEEMCDIDAAKEDVNKSIQNLAREGVEKSPITPDALNVIEDSICEEVPTTSTYQEDLEVITNLHLAEDTICEEVAPNNEDTPATEEAESVELEEVAPPGQTPIPKRLTRRFSTDQNAEGSTPRRSVRRASMEANNKLEQCLKPTRRASCSAAVEIQPSAALATPKRKRRLTEELSTPTRKSQRLLCTTPKGAVQLDESVGDMGIIIEEDGGSADGLPVVTDEDYGNELPTKDTDDAHRIDYQGMRELLKTPKSCSTPHFRGLRELVRTPKDCPSPMLGNIEELLETPSTPRRSVTVNRVALELSKAGAPGDAQDMYFKTPRGKNLMIPNDPASAVLKATNKSLATTTEYDLNATNATLHLDKIFDDVLVAETTDPSIAAENSENEINVTAISTVAVSEADPLSTTVATIPESSDTARSEALMNICYAETSHKDPLTSTAFKDGGKTDFNLSALNDESCVDRAKSPDICEMSGIQMLDQTTDSMFSEPLVVTGVDSCDVTLEETKATGNNLPDEKKDAPGDGSDTDSMVGLSEPLVVSDDEDIAEEPTSLNQEQIKESQPNDSSMPPKETKINNGANRSVIEQSSSKGSEINSEPQAVESVVDKKPDETETDAVEMSSVRSKIEESIDLVEEENDEETELHNSLGEMPTINNEQSDGQDASHSLSELLLDNQFEIDLDVSSTAIDESLSQNEKTTTSTIYAVELSRVSSNIQGKETDKEESIIEGASDVEQNSENVAEKSAAITITETGDMNDLNSSMPVESIQLEQEAEKDTDSDAQLTELLIEQIKEDEESMAQLEVTETTIPREDIELNASAELTLESADKSILNDTSQLNKSSIGVDKTESSVAEPTVNVSDNPLLDGPVIDAPPTETTSELPVKEESLNDANTTELIAEDESLIKDNSTESKSGLPKKQIGDIATDLVEISIDDESAPGIKTINKTSETGVEDKIKTAFKDIGGGNSSNNTATSSVQVSQLNEVLTSNDQLLNESANETGHATKSAHGKLATSPSSEDVPSEIKEKSVNMDASLLDEEKKELLHVPDCEDSSQTDLEAINDESLDKKYMSIVVDSEKKEEQAAKTLSISSVNLTNESQHDLEATNADDSATGLLNDNEHVREVAETSSNLNDVQNLTRDSLNADDSLISMDTSVVELDKNVEVVAVETATTSIDIPDEIKPTTEVLEAENIEEHVKETLKNVSTLADKSTVESTFNESVIDLDDKCEKEDESIIEKISDSVSKSPEKTMKDLDGSEALDNMESKGVDNIEVDLDGFVTKEYDVFTPSTSAEKSSNGSINREAQAALEETNEESVEKEISTTAEELSTQNRTENKAEVVLETRNDMIAAGVDDSAEDEEHNDAVKVPIDENRADKKNVKSQDTVNVIDDCLAASSLNKQDLFNEEVSKLVSRAELETTNENEKMREAEIAREAAQSSEIIEKESQVQLESTLEDEAATNLNDSMLSESVAVDEEKSPQLLKEFKPEVETTNLNESLLSETMAVDDPEEKLNAEIEDKTAHTIDQNNESKTLEKSIEESEAAVDMDASCKVDLETTEESLPMATVSNKDTSEVLLNASDVISELDVIQESRPVKDTAEQTEEKKTESPQTSKNLIEKADEAMKEVLTEAEKKDSTSIDEPAVEILDSNGEDNQDEKTTQNTEKKTESPSIFEEPIESTEPETDSKQPVELAGEIPSDEDDTKEILDSDEEDNEDEKITKNTEKQIESPSTFEEPIESTEPETYSKQPVEIAVEFSSHEDETKECLKSQSESSEDVEKNLSTSTIEVESAVEIIDSDEEAKEKTTDNVHNYLSHPAESPSTIISTLPGPKSKLAAEIGSFIDDTEKCTENADSINRRPSSQNNEKKHESPAAVIEPTVEIIDSDSEVSTEPEKCTEDVDKKSSPTIYEENLLEKNTNQGENEMPSKPEVEAESTQIYASAAQLIASDAENVNLAENKIKDVRAETTSQQPEEIIIEISSSDEDSSTQATSQERFERTSNEVENKIVNQVTHEKILTEVDTKSESVDKVILTVQHSVTTENSSDIKMEHKPKNLLIQRRRSSTLQKFNIETADVQQIKQYTRQRTSTVESLRVENPNRSDHKDHIDNKTIQQVQFEMKTKKKNTDAPESSHKAHAEAVTKISRRKSIAKDVETEVKNDVEATTSRPDKREIHTKRRARKSTSEVVETEAHKTEKLTETIDVNKAKRRGDKPSAEVIQTELQSEPKRRKLPEKAIPSVEVNEPEGKNTIDEESVSAEVVNFDIHVEFEEVVKAGAHKQTETVDESRPKRRGRKASKMFETEEHIEEARKETVHLENPKRRARKPSAEVVETAVHVDEKKDDRKRGRRASVDVAIAEPNAATTHSEETSVEVIKEPPRRRNRKVSAEVKDAVEPVQLPDKKPARNTRKVSAETVESDKMGKEYLPIIVDATEPDQKKLKLDKIADSDVAHKVNPRGRKKSISAEQPPESVEASTSLAKSAIRELKPTSEELPLATVPLHIKATPLCEKSATRRGRQATNDEPLRTPPQEIVEASISRAKSATRGRKATTEEQPVATVPLDIEATTSREKTATRRGRKASNEEPISTLPSELIEASTSRPKSATRGEKATIEEQPLVTLPSEVVETTTSRVKTATRRGRKATNDEPLTTPTPEIVEASTLPPKVIEATTSREKTLTRRGQKPTIDESLATQPLETIEASNSRAKSASRGRKATVEEQPLATMPLIVEATTSRVKSATRRGRKATNDEPLTTTPPEIVEASTLPSTLVEATSREKTLTRRGQKPTNDEPLGTQPLGNVEASTSREKSATRRGRKPTNDELLETLPAELVEETTSREKSATRERKATVDEENPSVEVSESAAMKPKRRTRKASAEVIHVEAKPLEPTDKPTRRGRGASADLAAGTDTAVEKKTTRRGLKPLTNVDVIVEEAQQPKKTTGRRGRKASLSAVFDETDNMEHAIVVSAIISPKPQVLSSEDELTPRRREGRNLPRKNYDETSDEDKPGSSRKARKPVANKAAVVSVSVSPLPKPGTPTTQKPSVQSPVQPATNMETPINTIVPTDMNSSQKREGRNMPRKNYNETSDDEKPASSRGRRIRQPTIKALELLVDSASRPATPKRRGKAKTADADTEEPPEKKLIVNDSTPVPPKARGGARGRKLQEVAEVTDAEQAKGGARNRKESATSQADETGMEVEAKQPAKRNARGGNIRKAKAVDEAAEEQPPIKKVRGGTRAKTPVDVEAVTVPEVEETKEVPATKRTAVTRGRNARVAKVSDGVEFVSETPPSRTGRGRKVHFEPIEDTASVAVAMGAPQLAADDAPKRATRSRRK